MARIHLQNLRKTFRDVTAVKKLELEIPDESFAAFLGPSGCGKTTTLRMIAGLETPTSGDIYFDKRRMNDVPPGERDIGFVFQNYAIFTHMSVYDNVAFGLKVRGVSADTIRRRVEEVADVVQIRPMLARNAGRLGVNDMQRVALARSMILEPTIFLLDEPFSNLDAAFRAYMRGELKRIQHEIRQTMIYVTHDQVEAMSMADYIAVMDFGVLQQFGTPDEIYNQPANTFVANFIGSPNMNFIDCSYTVDDGVGYLVDRVGDVRVVVPDARRRTLERRPDNSELVVGIRPEHLHVSSHSPGNGAWRGDVYVIEPLGQKTIVHISAGETVIRVTAPADYLPNVGETQWIEYDRDYMHIFDRTSGTAIR